MAITDASYIGKGRIFLQPYGGASAGFEIGNCSALTLSAAEDVKELMNFKSSGGGKANTVRRISGVTLAMTLHDINADNLSLAAFGSKTTVTAGTVTNETKAAYVGTLCATDYLIDTSASVTVTGPSSTPAFTEGTHFEKTAAGVLILAAPGGWTSGQNIEIDYTKKAGSVVEALTASAQEYKLVFSGLDEAQSGKPVVVVVHRFKPGPLQNFGLISDDFAGVEITGEVLADATITTAGLSQYFKVAAATR